MARTMRTAIIAGLIASLTSCANSMDLSTIRPNDNTQPAGTLRNGVLTLALETRLGSWEPDGVGGKTIDSLVAFAEVGRAPSTPGPLIRVPAGTKVKGTLHNTLAHPLTVFGLGRTRAFTDSLVIAPGASQPFEFAADQAGTFVYVAHTHVDPVLGTPPEETQLHGGIVIDRPGAPADRIMGISWYFTLDTTSANGVGPATMTINGLSWPHTERLTYAQGDSVHWRVVNFTDGDHPMHLHGFYFRVDEHSANGVDTLYTPDQQRMAVTEVINPYDAVELSWKAERAGNWVFHCHYATHLSSFVTLDTKNGVLDSSAAAHHMSDRPHQMYGLVMGITVTPKGTAPVAAAPDRIIRIEQRKQPKMYGDQPGMAFAVTNGAGTPDTSMMPVPGPALILERGKRVQVTIVNTSDEHAAIHWHGIELESYPDGVPGWSGSGKDVSPAIPSHDSLTVRWTPPRAGSFMYHSHFNESRQMGGGAYGPIIVLEPGEHYDPQTDRTLFFGTAGTVLSFAAAPPAVLLNGSAHPAPMDLKAGTTYRFRLFNLAGDNPTFVSLNQQGKPVEWRAVAKDGYPLPASQATVRPAVLMFDPGEIYDFEFTPDKAGEFAFSFGLPQPPPPPSPKAGEPTPPPSRVPPLVNVAVHVR